MKGILIFAFSFFSIISYGQKNNILIDKVVAKVGSEIILLSEIEDEFSYARSSDPNVDESLKCNIMENLIAQKLIVYRAIVDSVDVLDIEVDAQLDLRFDRILRQMNGDETFFQEYYSATVNEMKERYRDDQKQKLLSEKMQAQLINEVSITPSEVKEFFRSIPSDSIPYLNAEVEIAEIVMKAEVNHEEKTKAILEIEEVLKKLKEGGDFAELAKLHSDDTESAKRGGDLGFAKRGSYVPDFESAAYNLEPMEISEVVETGFGYHILQLVERRGNVIKVNHILVTPEITSADEDLAVEKLDSIRTLIGNDSLTFSEAVKTYSMDDYPSFSNAGKVRNPNTGDNFFETKDLDPDTYFAIEEMNVDGLSEVLILKNPRGGNLFRLITLQSKTKPHKLNLNEDYDKISQFAKENKKSTYFNEWIQSKMFDTLIVVDPLYEGCENLQVITKS